MNTFKQLSRSNDIGGGMRHVSREVWQLVFRGDVTAARRQHALQQRAVGLRRRAPGLQRAELQL